MAGQDGLQGGTWLGLNTEGKFTAVTNYRDGTTQKPNARSRGHLTRSYLTQETNAQDFLHSLLPVQNEYGDYNLLLGDPTGIYYQSNREGKIHKLSPGIYGLSNALLNTPWPKLNNACNELSNLIVEKDLNIDKLAQVMGDTTTAEDHELPQTGISFENEKLFSSVFIESEHYGTRATTLLLQKSNGDTQIIEKRFDRNGLQGENQFQLTLETIG